MTIYVLQSNIIGILDGRYFTSKGDAEIYRDNRVEWRLRCMYHIVPLGQWNRDAS